MSYEKGIITKKDTGGIELTWGNHEAMMKMIRQMVYKEGFGAVLAQGTKKAAEIVGQDSEKFAIHVKGLELPAYDVRGAKAQGMGFATSYNGADHCRSYAFQEIFGIPVPEPIDRLATKGKGKLTKWNQDKRSASFDCATMCGFLFDMAVPATACQHVGDMVSAATGIKFSAEDVEGGKRHVGVYSIFAKVLSLLSLPRRLMNEPVKLGDSGSKDPPERPG
jgi:aldehyde:ferredoxin oxidoreductase